MRLPVRKCEFAVGGVDGPSGDRIAGVEHAPSGLFSRAAFEREVLEQGRPGWWQDPTARERRYRRWVYAEAAGLLAQLGRLDLSGAGTAVAPIQSLAGLLAQDVAWAEAPVAAAPGVSRAQERAAA